MEAPEKTTKTINEYADFLASKRILADPCGFDVADADLNPMLFPFQRDICRWALKRGKAAVFAHTGLGKGPIQLEWCRHVSAHTGGNTLILAPLAVSQQFKREAEKFGIPVSLCREQWEVQPGINITNYERLDSFSLSSFAGVALDESSCIKDWTGKTTQRLIEGLSATPFKLCSTATPSPNDHAELGTHAELLDVMRRSAMLAMFFEHDGGETSKWSLKGHGKRPFWKFVASWAVCVKKPSDLGYDDGGFALPPLRMHEHIVSVDHSVNTDGMLFRCPDLSATGLHKELRLTCDDRARRVAELIINDWSTECGNLNTLKPADRNTVPTQNTQPNEGSKGGRRRKTRSTCKSITLPTKTNTTKQESAISPQSMRENERHMPPTHYLERPPEPAQGGGNFSTQTSDSINECGAMGSPGTSTTAFARAKMEHVRFVEAQVQTTSRAEGSTLITVTVPEESVGSCAPIAISASESSKTIQSLWDALLHTCKPPQWIVWCNTNYEQVPLAKAFGDACISIDGSMSPEEKERRIVRWLANDRPILLTKPSVAGFGLNFQNCSRMAFVGLGYSFESVFQAIRRCWRYGQTRPVDAHLVIAETEGAVLSSIRRKEAQYEELQAEMNEAMREEQLAARHKATRYDHETIMEVPSWLQSQQA